VGEADAVMGEEGGRDWTKEERGWEVAIVMVGSGGEKRGEEVDE